MAVALAARQQKDPEVGPQTRRLAKSGRTVQPSPGHWNGNSAAQSALLSPSGIDLRRW